MTAALSSITGRMAGIAKTHDLIALDAFIASPKFLELFGALPAQKKPSVFKAYNTTRLKCLQWRPVAAPKTATADWKKPGEIDRFKTLWFKHGGNRYLVARAMRITEGAVKVAYHRFIKNGATTTYVSVKNRNRKPQESREAFRPPLVPRSNSDSVRAARAAA